MSYTFEFFRNTMTFINQSTLTLLNLYKKVLIPPVMFMVLA